jgi:serine/threonine protein kinase
MATEKVGNGPGRGAEEAGMNPETWGPGETVAGTKWVIERRLGEGGMGIVFQVRKEPAGIAGAMKVMRGQLASSRAWGARFLSEAQLLASVRHPHLVEIIDYDTLADGTPYMVMALLKGQTLRSCLRDARNVRATIPAHNMWVVLSQLCEGLHVLHAQPAAIVHGDVKPENVFLQKVENVPGAATVRLLDFGLARVAGQSLSFVVGTPRYMAPEQLRGAPVGERADQYAAAMIAYEMLTGRMPWDVAVRDHEGVMQAHLTQEPAAPSKFCAWVPRALDEAILRALRKDPTERWGSIAGFAEAMRVLRDVNDGSAYANVDVNTTAPDLATMTVGPDEYRLVHDTDEMPAMDVVCGSWPRAGSGSSARSRSALGAAVTVPGDPAVIEAARQACREEVTVPVVIRPIVALNGDRDASGVDGACDTRTGDGSTDATTDAILAALGRSAPTMGAIGTASDHARPWVVPVERSKRAPVSERLRETSVRRPQRALAGWMMFTMALGVGGVAAASVVARAARDARRVEPRSAETAARAVSGEPSIAANGSASTEWVARSPMAPHEPVGVVASLTQPEAVPHGAALPSAVVVATTVRPSETERPAARGGGGAAAPGLGEFKSSFGMALQQGPGEASQATKAKAGPTGGSTAAGTTTRRTGPASSAAALPDDGRDLF